MDTDFKPVLEQIEKEKGIPANEVLEMVESAITSAFKKHAERKDLNYHAKIDSQTGRIKVFVEKIVVRRVKDELKEIDHVSAMEIDSSVSPGDIVKVELPANKFGRIAAQTAKQIIIQKMRENERESIYQEFKDKEGRILTASVYRFIKNAVIVEIGKAEAIIPERELIKKQVLFRGENIKVYIVEVHRSSRGTEILASRTHPGLVAGLFKLEVPEIVEGIVEIKKIVRESGIRCKVAVLSNNPKVDPIGSCVGINGVRVQSVINELAGERMDLIKYSDNISEYLANSLSPAKVSVVTIIDASKKEARLVVEDDMLSLAIGKNGQNVRLAARLTGWHIDIQSESQMKELKKKTFEDSYAAIINLPGVGQNMARLLIEGGYDTIDKIRNLKLESLTAIKGIGEKTAMKILKAAGKEKI